MSCEAGPNISEDGLVLSIDSANTKSYPGTGTVAYNLVNNSSNGTLSRALIYDGSLFTFVPASSDNIILPNDVGYTTDFSQFAFFRSLGAPSTGFHIIFGGAEAEISIPAAGELRIGVHAPSRSVGNLGSGLTNGEWHYVGATYKTADSFITGFIDGESVGTVATGGGLLPTSLVRRIGKFGTSTQYWTNGNIDCASIYNRGLSATEVKQNFEALRSRFGI